MADDGREGKTHHNTPIRMAPKAHEGSIDVEMGIRAVAVRPSIQEPSYGKTTMESPELR